MAKRCVVFVDGENLRHGIVDLFRGDFDKRDYLPKNANWTDFFDAIVAKSCVGGERLRTYWYVVDSVDFFPHRMPSAIADLRRFLTQNDPNKKFVGLSGVALDEACQREAARIRDYRQTMEQRHAAQRSMQTEIATAQHAIEFRRAGAIRFDLIDGKYGSEKAVDVKLATDLIVLREIYDVAIVVSGDADYVPAVQFVKDAGKRVVNVAFERSNGQLHPGGARRLNTITDQCIRIGFADLAKYMGISNETG